MTRSTTAAADYAASDASLLASGGVSRPYASTAIFWRDAARPGASAVPSADARRGRFVEPSAISARAGGSGRIELRYGNGGSGLPGRFGAGDRRRALASARLDYAVRLGYAARLGRAPRLGYPARFGRDRREFDGFGLPERRCEERWACSDG